MNEKMLKAVKVLVPVASIAVTLATNYFADKDLDEKVGKKVAEALAKTNGEEA
jgi:hypothetical protein